MRDIYKADLVAIRMKESRACLLCFSSGNKHLVMTDSWGLTCWKCFFRYRWTRTQIINEIYTAFCPNAHKWKVMGETTTGKHPPAPKGIMPKECPYCTREYSTLVRENGEEVI